MLIESRTELQNLFISRKDLFAPRTDMNMQEHRERLFEQVRVFLTRLVQD